MIMNKVELFVIGLRNNNKYLQEFAVTLDADITEGAKWITTEEGSHVLLDKDGTVLGGMGGKFNGKNIKDAHGTKKFTKHETNAETSARHDKEFTSEKNWQAKQEHNNLSIKSMPRAEDYTSGGAYNLAMMEYRKSNKTENNKPEILRNLNSNIEKATKSLKDKQSKGEKAFTSAQAKIDAKAINQAEEKLNSLKSERHKLLGGQNKHDKETSGYKIPNASPKPAQQLPKQADEDQLATLGIKSLSEAHKDNIEAYKAKFKKE